MIAVLRPDLADDDWKKWRENAQQAMDQLVNQYKLGEEVELQEAVYQEAKPFLLKLTRGKCAYCESRIEINQPGDVEHYRPKGRIRDEYGKVLKVKVQDSEIVHPGYWWLAYDWLNLLPSCIDCNRRRRHGFDGALVGKADFFPVRGQRAVLPNDDLVQEQPLLLDPSMSGFDPKVHFEFLRDGTLKPITEEARHSCELLGLNLREALVSEREQTYVQAKQALASMFTQLLNDAPKESILRTRRLINDMWNGHSAFSAFGRRALEDVVDQLYRSTGTRFDLPLH